MRPVKVMIRVFLLNAQLDFLTDCGSEDERLVFAGGPPVSYVICVCWAGVPGQREHYDGERRFRVDARVRGDRGDTCGPDTGLIVAYAGDLPFLLMAKPANLL